MTTGVGRLSQCLGDNLVAHPTVDCSANRFFRVKVVREAQVNLTGFIKRLYLVSGKRKIKTPEVVLKLREFACPNDRDDWHTPSPQPCQPYLCHTAACLVRHSFDG